MVKYRYGKIPVYTRVRFPIPGISVLGFRHPVDGYGAAAGARPRRVAPRCAPRARKRVLEFAPLGATRLKADARDAPPFLIIEKGPVRAALGPARRAVARRGAG